MKRRGKEGNLSMTKPHARPLDTKRHSFGAAQTVVAVSNWRELIWLFCAARWAALSEGALKISPAQPGHRPINRHPPRLKLIKDLKAAEGNKREGDR